jgi:hypothetical protein
MRPHVNSHWQTDTITILGEGGKRFQNSNLGFKITQENINVNYLTSKYQALLLGHSRTAH